MEHVESSDVLDVVVLVLSRIWRVFSRSFVLFLNRWVVNMQTSVSGLPVADNEPQLEWFHEPHIPIKPVGPYGVIILDSWHNAPVGFID